MKEILSIKVPQTRTFAHGNGCDEREIFSDHNLVGAELIAKISNIMKKTY